MLELKSLPDPLLHAVEGLSFSAHLNFHHQHLFSSTHQAALVSPSRGESQGSLSWGPALP